MDLRSFFRYHWLLINYVLKEDLVSGDNKVVINFIFLRESYDLALKVRKHFFSPAVIIS